jgi:hypothetical protein
MLPPTRGAEGPCRGKSGYAPDAIHYRFCDMILLISCGPPLAIGRETSRKNTVRPVAIRTIAVPGLFGVVCDSRPLAGKITCQKQ